MQPAGALRDRSSPRDRKRQKQRVQTRIVESLANVFASREDDSSFVARDGRETLVDRLPLLLPAGAQDDNVIDARRKLLCSKRSRCSFRSVRINGERPLRTESTTSSQIRRVRV